MSVEFNGRPSWDQYFLRMLPLIASRSTCFSRQIGAIITKRNRIISTGYNGSPPGLKHCAELGGCVRRKAGVPSGEKLEICRAVHAEKNAILFSREPSLEGATIYVSCTPCTDCMKSIITVGIKRIVHYQEPYPNDLAERLAEEAGVQVDWIPLGEQ